MKRLILKSYDSKSGSSVSEKHLNKTKEFLQELFSYTKPGHVMMLPEPLFYIDGRIDYAFNRSNTKTFLESVENSTKDLDRLGSNIVYLQTEEAHGLASIVGVTGLQTIAEMGGYPRFFMRTAPDQIMTFEVLQECMPRTHMPFFIARSMPNVSLYLGSSDAFADMVLSNIKKDDKLGLINDFDTVVDVCYAITRRYRFGRRMDTSKEKFKRDTFRVYQFNMEAEIPDHVYTSKEYQDFIQGAYTLQADGRHEMAKNMIARYEKMNAAGRLWKNIDPDIDNDI